MKRKILKYTAIALLLIGTVACEDKTKTESDYAGISPFSIEDVVDVFELKYGEVKDWLYNDQVFRFSITDIEDNLLNCATFDIDGNPEEAFNRIILSATLCMETNKKVSIRFLDLKNRIQQFNLTSCNNRYNYFHL
jgi:hypothetical protein